MIRKIKAWPRFFKMNEESAESWRRRGFEAVYRFKHAGQGERFDYSLGKIVNNTNFPWHFLDMRPWRNIEITREEALQMIPCLPEV